MVELIIVKYIKLDYPIASPEYTRDRKRLYMYICSWGDHFSEGRVRFWMHKVMVVMHIILYDNSVTSKDMKLKRWVQDHAGKAQIHNITGRSTSLSMKVTSWRVVSCLQVLGLVTVMAVYAILKFHCRGSFSGLAILLLRLVLMQLTDTVPLQAHAFMLS